MDYITVTHILKGSFIEEGDEDLSKTFVNLDKLNNNEMDIFWNKEKRQVINFLNLYLLHNL